MGMIDICQEFIILMLGMATHMVNPEMANAFAEHFQVESCSLPQEGTFPMD